MNIEGYILTTYCVWGTGLVDCLQPAVEKLDTHQTKHTHITPQQ